MNQTYTYTISAWDETGNPTNKQTKQAIREYIANNSPIFKITFPNIEHLSENDPTVGEIELYSDYTNEIINTLKEYSSKNKNTIEINIDHEIGEGNLHDIQTIRIKAEKIEKHSPANFNFPFSNIRMPNENTGIPKILAITTQENDNETITYFYNEKPLTKDEIEAIKEKLESTTKNRLPTKSEIYKALCSLEISTEEIKPNATITIKTPSITPTIITVYPGKKNQIQGLFTRNITNSKEKPNNLYIYDIIGENEENLTSIEEEFIPTRPFAQIITTEPLPFKTKDATGRRYIPLKNNYKLT